MSHVPCQDGRNARRPTKGPMTIKIRKGQAPGQLERDEFSVRFRASFVDPAFRAEDGALAPARGDRLGRVSRRPQGADHAQGRHGLRRSRLRARRSSGSRPRSASSGRRSVWADPKTRTRALVICGSPRNDGTCPGEISKTFRLAGLVSEELSRAKIEVDFLDLSLLTSEYGRKIHPCKGCVSTAMPLCHWPCSCYPNHSLDQVNDWMNEIYERWVAAHAIVIVTPTHWYQRLERAQADDRPAGLRRRRQPGSDLDPRQEARRRRRRSSSPAGTIRSTSPAAPTAWWSMATSPASRARAGRCPTGSTGWA